MNKKAIAFLLVLSGNALACEGISLNLHFASKHFGDAQGYEFNESSPGIGLSCNKVGYSYTAGVYKNSYYKQTFYAGMTSNTHINRYKIGVAYGLASGYDDIRGNVNSVVPYGFITAGFKLNRTYSVNVLYAPYSLVLQDSVDVLTAMLEVKF